MTFEEFFKKKRIDLTALQSGEPGLYLEFEKHFNQMGEKSFDHTKKYWFNKLRLLYHLAPELKPEKVHIENRLAEQTITESLLEEKIPAPSVGFKPRFKAGMGSKPAEEDTSDLKDPLPKESATATPEVNAAAATGDQNPLFVQEQAAMQAKADSMPRTTDGDAAEGPPLSPQTKPAGFTPRFKAGVTKATQTAPSEPQDDTKPTKGNTDPPASKPAGFKPRFNMKTMAPKSTEDMVKEQKADISAVAEAKAETPEADKPAEAPLIKPAGFKPRFNAKMMKPKPPEEEEK